MLTPVLSAHPFLDPRLSDSNPSLYRHLYKWYFRIKEEPEAYNGFLNKILNPLGDKRSLQSNQVTGSYYLNEAVGFLGELLLMVSPELRASITPRPEVMGCPDILELLNLVFGAHDSRVAFEAQRKLYLTKLFFDVDHCWEVQRGAEHKEYFETLLERELFSTQVGQELVDLSYRIRPDGESIEYVVGRNGTGQEFWTFNVRELNQIRDGRPGRFHVYYYACRFKREIMPYQYERGADHYQLAPTEVWPGLTKRRSASIVSKMIRKGENDPRRIEDLIGAMFIVEDLYELESLKEILFDLFGGVFRLRNPIDTLTQPSDRRLLNPWSGQGYEVYKAEVDVLYNPERHPLPLPYFFTVELQMYTLESYLRTIHSAHYASHQALKRRQFLQGLVPYLFPESIYGPEVTAALAAEEANGAPGNFHDKDATNGFADRSEGGAAAIRHAAPGPAEERP